MGIIMHTNIIYFMPSLNQNTIFPKLAFYFYVYLRIIDNINFPNTCNTCPYIQSTFMSIYIKKTYSPVMLLGPILVLIFGLSIIFLL